MFDNNRRRRVLNRVKNGGAETRGRPPAGGMIDKYTGITEDDAWEFAQAMNKLQRTVRFPSWTEVLEVLKKLSYRKVDDNEELRDWDGTGIPGKLWSRFSGHIGE